MIKTSNFRQRRLQEFNDFDVERMLKENIDALVIENENRITFLETSTEFVSHETIEEFTREVQHNASEIMHVTSILHHIDDVYSYFSNGILFRKED